MEDGLSSVYIYNGVGEVPMNVTHVRVDPSVTVIPERVFEFRRLVEVELPEGLIRIEDDAFQQCYSLKKINIPSTVAEIARGAFSGCNDLEAITLPDGLQRLGQYAFIGCKSLQRINIPSNVETIEEGAFMTCDNLSEVLLSEGLRETENGAFSHCKSLESVTLPSTLKVIGPSTFQYCHSLNVKEINLHDTIETIYSTAFKSCNLQNFRMPSLVTDVDTSMFDDCKYMVSLELPNITRCAYIRGGNARGGNARLASLRNVAFPSSECEVDSNVLEGCIDLKQLFLDGSNCAVSEALQSRFDDLPIHKICYYQSYNDNKSTLKSLKQDMDSTGVQQDCLGMTPLHILACSTKPTIEMYRLLIDKYPETLIMKDKWGDIPLVYALWCNAPSAVIDMLVKSYKLNYQDYKFDWSRMIEIMAKHHVPLANIQKLISTQKRYSPDYEFDMQRIILSLEADDSVQDEGNIDYNNCIPFKTIRYLLRLSITNRLESLNVMRFCLDLEDRIETFPKIQGRTFITKKGRRHHNARDIYHILATYESIKEGTSILELALWKAAIDDSHNKRSRVDIKEQCRINCGADIVIRNVLPYLLPKPQARVCPK